MPTLQERLSEIMEAMNWAQADIRRISGQSPSTVSQWLGNVGENGKIIKSIGKQEAAKALADASGFESLWIAKGLGPKFTKDAPRSEGLLAHGMSLDRAETVPSITREQLNMIDPQNLPGVFRMPVENEEMIRRVRPGAWVQFSSSLAKDAKPGDGVLVRDGVGGLHFRIYKSGRPGVWEAHAENENYRTLLSDTDGLSVIAVLTAVEGRWS